MAYVHGSMEVGADGGTAEISLAVVLVDGTERELATWSTEIGAYDRLALSRSPDGGRVAAVAGTAVRTFDVRDGVEVASSPIANSEPETVVLGWPEVGGPATHVTSEAGEFGKRVGRAADLAGFPIGGGWTIDVDGPIVDDGGFAGGYVSSSVGIGWSIGTPDGQRSDDAASARERAIEASRLIPPSLRVRARRGDVAAEWSDDVVGGERGAELNWPPIVGPRGVLFRRTGSVVEIREPGSPFDIGAGSSEGPLPPWFVTNEGHAAALAVELAVTPVCALPDGRFLLPGASETWRDGGDEPMHAVTPDGVVEPWLVGGRTTKPSQLVALVAPDLL
ncbi:MAG: hypothetical protein Q7T55_01680, partial [Solirubrobacteraceae bacterium]|nr:hypothetical protein [Solirubrobacteraceae bacterium]